MFCFKCGNKLEPRYAFCPKCGTRLPEGYWDLPSAGDKSAAPDNVTEVHAGPAAEPAPAPAPISKPEPQPEPAPQPVQQPAAPAFSQPVKQPVTPAFAQPMQQPVPPTSKPVSPTSKPVPPASKPVPAPQPIAQSVQQQPVPEPQPEPAPVQQAAQQSEPQHEAIQYVQSELQKPGESSGEPLLTCRVLFTITEPGKNFVFGGADEGYASIYNDHFDLTKKSKMTAAAFGLIGSAIEGKGKPFKTLYRNNFTECNKEVNKKGALLDYKCIMTDGKVFTLRPSGSGEAEAERLFDKFFGLA